MDFKELAKKVIDGGNADELTKDLDEKSKSEVWKEVGSERKKIADAELAVIEARKQERKRVETDLESTKNQIGNDVRGQMRSEQTEIAFTIARSKLESKGVKLTPEVETKLREDFKKFDSGKFDATLQVADILKTYAASNAETLIDAIGQNNSNERGASEFNSAGSSGGSTGAGTTPEPPMSQFVKTAMQAAQRYGVPLTRAEAEKAEKLGTDWKRMGVDTTKPPKV